MKILWAAILGMLATAWAFEGDWSTWDGNPSGKEAMSGAAPAYVASLPADRSMSIYEFRALGRSESRWMGSLEGDSPSLADLDGKSHFDWTRWLGRAEAHHIAGTSRTAAYSTSSHAPISEPSTGKELGCNLVEANRERGRAEAREIGRRQVSSGESPTTWEMDEETEKKAVAAAISGSDC